MSLIDIISAPRIGYYDAENKISVSFEYSRIPISGSRINGTIALSGDGRFDIIAHEIKKGFSTIKKYLSHKDVGFLDIIMSGIEGGVDVLVHFGKDGLTLAKVITIDAKNVDVIFEKYARNDYAFQLAFTDDSSIKFPWSNAKLVGQFYFNLKGSAEESHKTITGYTNFHLGNAAAATPVKLSAGVMKRKPISDTPSTKNKNKKSQLEVHTYALLQSRKYKGITVKEILSLITPDSIDIPDALDNVSIRNFGILKSKKEGSKSLAIICDCVIKINNNKVNTKLTIISKTIKNDKGVEKKEFTFKGKITVGKHKFNIKFDKQKEGTESSWSMLADYDSGKTKTHLDFRHLVEGLFGKASALTVPDLSLDIDKFKAFFYYKKKKSQDKSKNESVLLLGMGAGINVNMEDLPLAGPILVEAKSFKLKEVLALYASGEIAEEDLKLIKALPSPKKTEKNAKEFKISKGVTITAELVVDGTSELYTFGSSTGKSNAKTEDHDKIEYAAADAREDHKNTTDKAPKDIYKSAAWKTVDKKMGPVNLQRLGLAYDSSKGKLVMLLDAALEMKGMSLQMMGLGVGFNLDWGDLSPDFYLSGLGLSYTNAPVGISGGLLRTIDDNGGVSYDGAVRINMKAFSISGMGSYATTSSGESSLFLYGLLEGNIGGPPVFFVTAIAAGFGYNRRINAPAIEDVADYPLVALAMSPEDKPLVELSRELSSGPYPIEVSPGDYWFALGIRFSSFSVLETFLLLTANFGNRTEFNILGLSRLSWPKKELRDKLQIKEPLAFIELAIKASYSVGSDVVKVDGVITPNSFVLSKDCKLTGGFAFYTWVAGKHKGDFVLTVGGYHPKFKKPEHYPDVSRVALNWKLLDGLSIHGELYFALTPSAIMMGGRWALILQTDVIKASIVMWIDILMQWAPFHYDLSVGIILSIEAHIPLKLITVHLNLEIRAQLHIWGPPFSGLAEIDLGIYSYELAFGDKSKTEQKHLEWQDFAEGFLPEKKPEMDRYSQDDLDYSSGIEVEGISIGFTRGVIQKGLVNKSEEIEIANPLNMELNIDSAIPSKRLYFNEVYKKEYAYNDQVGVKPCGLSADEVSLDMHVSCYLNGDSKVENFIITPGTKNFPASLWGVQNKDGKDDLLGKTKLVENVLSGLSAKPKAPIASELKSFDFSKFVKLVKRTESIPLVVLEKSDEFNSSDVYGVMKKYSEKTDRLVKIEDSIADLGLDWGGEMNHKVDVAAVQDSFSAREKYFHQIPKLCRVGHISYNPKDTTE